MKKPRDVLDRDDDWAELVSCLESDGPELYIVTGRRRAGKSYLLTRFAAAAKGIYYQATKRTEKEQIATLSRIVGEHFDDPALRRVTLPDWEHLFGYLVERRSRERLVLVLDEFPYLADAAPALTSILQSLWDHTLADSRIKLVLSGSHVAAMKRLTEADRPLYGRRTGQLNVRPFTYADAARFVPGYEPRDRMLLYGILGGLPGQLRLVDPEKTLAQNAARLLLNPSSRLHDEAAHVFDSFVSEAEVHYSILEAIAAGETRWNKIANRTGKNTASLKRPLDWLLDMDVVRREAPITEYPNPAPKTLRYRVTDPYLLFWYRIIADIRARGLATLREPDDLWRAVVEPQLDRHMGDVYEEACRSFVAHGRHPRMPFRPIQVGSWWTEDGQEEVDVVALGPDGEVLLGEAKWGKVSSTDLDTLLRRGEILVPKLGGVRSVTYALFSGRGYQDASVDSRVAAGEAIHFPLSEMYP
jgi:uncharacterized protein